MHAQDLFAADEIRIGDHDMAVETARAQQRRIEHVRAVGGRDQDHAFGGFEAVHFDQQLIERLFALVIATAQARAAMAADGVDFVDEDDARRVLLGLLEHIAHARRTDAHEHLDEIGARDREERNIGLARDGAREQRLAGARRADKQHALGNAPAKALEFLRVFQEIDDLLEIVLRLVDARHILKGDAALALGQQLGARFAEAHRLAAAGLHRSDHPYPYAYQQEERQVLDQDGDEIEIVVGRLRIEVDVMIDQPLDQTGIFGLVGRELLARTQGAANLIALNRDLFDGSVVNLLDKFRIFDALRGLFLTRALKQVEKHHQQQRDQYPQSQIAKVVQGRPLIGGKDSC